VQGEQGEDRDADGAMHFMQERGVKTGGQCSGQTEDRRENAAQCGHADTARDHGEDQQVEDAMDITCQTVGPGHAAAEKTRPFGAAARRHADKGKQQDDQPHRHVAAQRVDFLGRVVADAGHDEGAHHQCRDDQAGDQPMQRAHDRGMATGCVTFLGRMRVGP